MFQTLPPICINQLLWNSSKLGKRGEKPVWNTTGQQYWHQTKRQWRCLLYASTHYYIHRSKVGWVVTYLLICMVVFCLLIQWGVVATILFPKSFVVLVVIMVIFMLSSPTCFGIRERIGGMIYVWYVYYQTFLTKFVWCTFMLRLHHSSLKQLKSQQISGEKCL